MHFMPSICAQKKTMKRSLMTEKKQEEPTNQSKSPTDSDTSDDTAVNPRLKIPRSAIETQIALSHSRA